MELPTDGMVGPTVGMVPLTVYTECILVGIKNKKTLR
jgi:hypothetical protein